MSRFLVTGSSGHLGDALVRVLRRSGHEVVGLDVVAAPSTTVVASITDRDAVRQALDGVDTVVHTATLHKPHVGSHSRQEFLDVNVTGTLTLLEAAAEGGVRSFVFTSSTSVFGRALTPAPGAPAGWITEDVVPQVRNVYGATKLAAEQLCELVAREQGLPVVVLRVARFFPEEDDRDDVRARYADANLKVNEYLYRRVDLADVVDAHLLAARHAPRLGFARYVISATTPFTPSDLPQLGVDAPAAVERLFPDAMARYRAWGWRMFPALDRVYVNERARRELGWAPRLDFRAAVDLVAEDGDPRSPLAREIGAKGYHDRPTGVYTTGVRAGGRPG